MRGALEWMGQHQLEMEALLRTLVEQNSGSYNLAGIATVQGHCRAFLEGLGFGVTRMIADDGREHLLAQIGDGPRRFFFSGHVDTVYEADHPFQSYTRDSERFLGPGVADMKGGVVALLFVNRYLVERGLHNRCCLTVVLNSDEEISSTTSQAIIESAAAGHDASLVFESARVNGDLVSARKGIGRFTITAHGQAAHSGLNHRDGANAIVALSRAIVAVDAITDYDRDVTINVGLVRGGSKLNIVPDFAEAKVDMRFFDPQVAEEASNAVVGAATSSASDDVRVIVNGGVLRPPWPEHLPGTTALVRRWTAAARQLGIQAGHQATGGGSDGCFTANLGIPTLDGLGPIGGGHHSSAEWALADSLPRRAALTAHALEQWATED